MPLAKSRQFNNYSVKILVLVYKYSLKAVKRTMAESKQYIAPNEKRIAIPRIKFKQEDWPFLCWEPQFSLTRRCNYSVAVRAATFSFFWSREREREIREKC